MKPFSESCERNKLPILSVIKLLLENKVCLLEIGSGTGQHATFFTEHLPHILWHTSDRQENHSDIQMWINDSPATNIKPPIRLDVIEDRWPTQSFDAVYSANTAHIMSWQAVQALFEGVGKVLDKNGVFMLYGPFNYNGKFSSESNKRFEQWLKNVDPERGIRDFEALDQLAIKAGMQLIEDYEMPANNRLLVWVK
jgi:cyclopropane fatty-acyl-phospholipid synthase-like methyltransferase